MSTFSKEYKQFLQEIFYPTLTEDGDIDLLMFVCGFSFAGYRRHNEHTT